MISILQKMTYNDICPQKWWLISYCIYGRTPTNVICCCKSSPTCNVNAFLNNIKEWKNSTCWLLWVVIENHGFQSFQTWNHISLLTLRAPAFHSYINHPDHMPLSSHIYKMILLPHQTIVFFRITKQNLSFRCKNWNEEYIIIHLCATL